MEHARGGLLKIVVEALRRAPMDDRPVLAWPLVCGAAVASNATALDFNRGVLRVKVPHVAWRSQLVDFVPQYLASLNDMVGGTVSYIQFVVDEELEAEKKKPADAERPPRRKIARQ